MTCIFHLQYIYVCMYVCMYVKPHLCVNICWLSEVPGPTTNKVNDANYFAAFQLDVSTLDKGFSRGYVHLVYMPDFILSFFNILTQFILNVKWCQNCWKRSTGDRKISVHRKQKQRGRFEKQTEKRNISKKLTLKILQVLVCKLLFEDNT